MEPIVLEPQSLLTWLIWYAIGQIGILMHVVIKAMKIGRTMAALKQYLKENSLVILSSELAYTAIVVLWVSEGISLLGLFKGYLTGAVIGVAYMGQSLVREAMEKRLKQPAGKADEE